MKQLNRRKFLKSGLIGTAGIVTLSDDMITHMPVEQQKNIIYRTLGKTGLKVPVIGMGVMNSDNPALVKSAFERGIVFFDTANGYQNGRNEEMLGNIFREHPRNSFILATKVGPAGVDRMSGMPTKETTSEDFLGKFNTSLKRLQMSYVDILYMHNISSPELVNFKPVVTAMQQLKKEGKVRFIGISTHNLPAIIDAMVKTDTWDVVLTTYNYLDTELIRARSEPPVKGMDIALKKAHDAGLGIVAMKTLAGGGFLDKERTRPINTTAAIKWALSNEYVHTVIPGMTTFDQLELNIKILENIALNDNEKKDIIAARAETGLYCLSCQNCLSGCKLSLPIPDLMRAYMYAYGYSDSSMAKNLLGELKASENPCGECNNCAVKCSRNFNVKEKIADITRLVNVPDEFLA